MRSYGRTYYYNSFLKEMYLSTQLIMMYKYPQITCVKVYIMCKFMNKSQDVPNKASTNPPH